jgi:hypothetical protein
MPVHDWTRVVDGLFHDFHHAWIGAIRDVLNEHLLPEDYYALAEATAGGAIPNVLTLEQIDSETGDVVSKPWKDDGGLALETVPPQVAYTIQGDERVYLRRPNRLAIFHADGDRVVAYIEIVSAGNKRSRSAMDQFLGKLREAFEDGLHLLVIDVHPPTPRDPHGIHHAIWQDWDHEVQTDEDDTQDKPLTLVSYRSDLIPTAYLQPIDVGDELPPMPLFYKTDRYVNVPLEETYQTAWRGFPKHWKKVLEGTT